MGGVSMVNGHIDTLMTDRERLIELFYENNVRCNQTVEGLADDVVDIIDIIINRQKAEIERLQNKLDTVKQKVLETIPLVKDDIKTAKAEAIKEFAERVKAEFQPNKAYTFGYVMHSIDYLVKEMAGDSNEPV